MIDKEQKIWQCISCGQYFVVKEEPKVCPKCGSNRIVFYDNYMITK